MGGILLRAYLVQHDVPALGRVVMLGPPNQGSEIVDRLANVPGFGLLNGPRVNNWDFTKRCAKTWARCALN